MSWRLGDCRPSVLILLTKSDKISQTDRYTMAQMKELIEFDKLCSDYCVLLEMDEISCTSFSQVDEKVLGWCLRNAGKRILGSS